jgi:hypothetical protein
MTKSARKQQAPLIFGGVVFFIGGIDALQNGDLLVGGPSLIAGLLNLVAVRFVASSPRIVALLLNVLNAILAGVMALSSVLAGKQYIQYAWGVAALFFVIAAFLAFNRSQTRARRAADSDAEVGHSMDDGDSVFDQR